MAVLAVLVSGAVIAVAVVGQDRIHVAGCIQGSGEPLGLAE